MRPRKAMSFPGSSKRLRSPSSQTISFDCSCPDWPPCVNMLRQLSMGLEPYLTKILPCFYTLRRKIVYQKKKWKKAKQKNGRAENHERYSINVVREILFATYSNTTLIVNGKPFSSISYWEASFEAGPWGLWKYPPMEMR